ncbi:hypothetical protein EMIT0111MI5_10763 [Burkholderia sp. IT-111MI5]
MCGKRPAPVVKLPPAFDEHLGCGTTAEPSPVQQFLARLAANALNDLDLPRTARCDEGRTDGSISRPAACPGRGKFKRDGHGSSKHIVTHESL